MRTAWKCTTVDCGREVQAIVESLNFPSEVDKRPVCKVCVLGFERSKRHTVTPVRGGATKSKTTTKTTKKLATKAAVLFG